MWFIFNKFMRFNKMFKDKKIDLMILIKIDKQV